MRYTAVVFLLIAAIHPISYAKHNWTKDNKLAAVGAMLLAMVTVVFPAILLFIR